MRKPRREHENGDRLKLDAGDLFGQLAEKQGSTLWLGRYRAEEIAEVLERTGIFPAMRQQGMDHFVVRIVPLEEFGQTLQVDARIDSKLELVAEARLREVRFQPPDKPMPERFSRQRPRMLAIDWLMMQNPDTGFTPERPPLPGQNHPGLGQARKVIKLLISYCRYERLAGLLNFPEYFHNAYLYRSFFHFYDPRREALLAALARDLNGLTLSQKTWAIEWGCVRHQATRERFEWTSAIQMLPLQQNVMDYFTSVWYSDTTHRLARDYAFAFDQRRFEAKWQKLAVATG